MTEPRQTTESYDPDRSQDQSFELNLTQDSAMEGTAPDSKAPRRPVPDLHFLAPALKPGELGRLGGYRILEVLGEGGMGLVFRAEDPHLQRQVAIKVVRPELAANPHSAERFLREARAAAKIKHDHVVTIYQVGQDRGVPFLALEFLRGESLDARLKQAGRLPAFEVLRIGHEAALGLAAAHEQGLIHRDIKPANVWLEAPNARVKLLDFGLARAANEDVHLTGSGAVVGTPAYMSPEQANGQSLDHRTDLFSLGVMLYRLVTGHMPFPGDSAMAILAAMAFTEPTPPRQFVPEVPPLLNDAILKLLAKKPADRIQTAHEVAELFAPAATSVTVIPLPAVDPSYHREFDFDEAPTVTVVQPAPHREPPKKRTPWALLAACGFLGFLTLLGGGVIVITILNKDGTTTRFTADSKSTITITPGPSGEATPAPKPALVKASPVVFSPVPATSPLDMLDPAKIPASEKRDWQPKELVGLIGTQRQRHWGGIQRVVYSPKGDLIATVGNDFMVRLWDAETMEEKAAIRGYPQFPEQLGAWFSPDGSRLAVWRDPEKRMSLYDVQQMPPRKVADFDAWSVSNPWFPDGKRLYLPSGSAKSQVWGVGGEKPILVKEFAPLQQHGSQLVLPNDRVLALGTYELPPNNFAILWDIGGDAPKELARQPLDAPEFAVSPDGKWFANGTVKGAKVRVFDLSGDKFTETGTFDLPKPLEGDRPNMMSFVPGTDDLMFVTHQGQWGIRDRKAGKIRPLSANHPGNAVMAFGPDGKRMACRSGLNMSLVVSFDMKPDGTATLRNDPDLTAGARPSGDAAWATTTSPVVTRWSLTGAAPSPLPIKQGQARFPATVLPDGRVVPTIEGSLTLALVDPRNGDGTPPVPLPTSRINLVGIAASASGKWLAVSRMTHGDRSPVLIDLKKPTPEMYATLTPNWPDSSGWAERFDFSRDDGFLLCWGSIYGETYLCDLRGSKPRHVASPKLPSGVPTLFGSMATLAVDRPIVVVGSQTGQIRLFDFSTGEIAEGPSMQPSAQSVTGAVLLPGGTELMACDNTGLIRFVEVPSGKVLREWQWPGPVHLRLSPDGRYVFAEAPDGGPLYILRLKVANPPLDEAWAKRVAELPAEEQVKAFHAEMVKRNPQFDPATTTPLIDKGKLTHLTFSIQGVTDLMPLRALPDLQALQLREAVANTPIFSYSPLAPLRDLTPLKGLPLTSLSIRVASVEDLSPLAGMPLNQLSIMGCRNVRDLSPLKGMPLTYLALSVSTGVTDLSPIAEMSLTYLEFSNTSVKSLQPLAKMPLKTLGLPGVPAQELEVLRGIKTLETIDGKPVADFWAARDAAKK